MCQVSPWLLYEIFPLKIAGKMIRFLLFLSGRTRKANLIFCTGGPAAKGGLNLNLPRVKPVPDTAATAPAKTCMATMVRH